MKVLILGVNGFIGYNLTKSILSKTNWTVYGFDISSSRISDVKGSRFEFIEGDVSINKEWVRYNISKCDVVIPLFAIATPSVYVSDPLKIFNLDFEENLEIIKLCVEYNKRIVFPSTSEVYGLCTDNIFDEDNSNFVQGPIHKTRWIYSCSKQLLDRVIYAYGLQKNLKYTLFRPFNWIGPNLDGVYSSVAGSSRVIIQFLENLYNGENIILVNGGKQKRCFTYISDGIDCLMKILQNKKEICDKQIFNIGNPDNEASIKQLAQILITLYKEEYGQNIESKIIVKNENEFYGDGYQDIYHRKPSIRKVTKLLGWKPTVSLEDSISLTFKNYKHAL
jgi:UDP-4-amino-4-deoxy-L-arabinose formyltransferase/UDP-glucuronic acid dehydrogenase (UDP-4-keto-hexauronic acid decarboxylating)